MTDFKIKMAELAKKYNISHKRDIDWHNFVYEVQQLKEDELKNVYDLKILPEYFRAVKSGEKTFEVRLYDRPFEKGEILHLCEWNGSDYTGESIYVEVTYILDNPDYCKEGYVIMAIRKMEQKSEWCEEDEKKMIFLERLIEHNVPDGQYGWADGRKGGFVTKSEAISMLKSLRPSWKPSEEQIKALLNAEGYLREGDQFDSAKSIAQLYEQLKRL